MYYLKYYFFFVKYWTFLLSGVFLALIRLLGTLEILYEEDSLKEINENFPASTVNVVLVISFLVTVPSVNLATIFWVKVRTWKCWNIVIEDVF